MPELHVYVDVIFLTNLLIDLVWLWAVAALSGLRAGFHRITAGALLGAALAVWAYFPSGRWLLGWPGLLAGTAAMLLAVFSPCKPYQFVRAAAYLLVSGGAMAGMSMLLGRPETGLAGGQLLLTHYSAVMIVVGILVTAVGIRKLLQAAQTRAAVSRGLYRLRIRVEGQVVELPALMDTGNRLADPISGSPVVVAEVEALSELLPGALQRATLAGWEGLTVLPSEWAGRCRMIPYQAVGRPSGMLLAIEPDEVAVMAPGGRDWVVCKALVALEPAELHSGGAFRALLGPAAIPGADFEPGIA